MRIFIYNVNAILYFLFLIFFLGSQASVSAQSSIYGKIKDGNSGEELIGVSVHLFQNGNMINETSTDIDGKYNFDIAPGIYSIEASYTGFPSEKIEDVVIKPNKQKKVNIDLEIGRGYVIYCYFFSGYKIPLIKIEDPTVSHTVSSEQIKNLPTRSINEMSTVISGVSFTR